MNICRTGLLAHVTLLLSLALPALSQTAKPHKPAAPQQAWSNIALDPDTRADLMIHEMTLDEKIQLVHGDGWGVLRAGSYVAPTHNGGAGFVPGIPRLGLPDINLADSAYGARMAAYQGRYATALPSVLGMAASWDPDAAFLYGSVIGRELRAMGFNMSIGGGVDLIREPRNGRNFEYASEDPILGGTMVGQLARGVQSNHIMGDIKHYVLNDQETGRNTLNAELDQRAMRETDLLAFQIAINLAKPAGVMCAYNRINGDYACENDFTLNQVLKHEWDFKGFVLSDWGGTHSTVKAALAGLDQDQPGDDNFFSEPLKQAILDGKVPQGRLDDMVHRLVRSMFATGVIDQPTMPRRVVDPFRGRDDAQKIEEESAVLLQNSGSILPLTASTRSIAIIGGHADVGVLSGGGSAQVDSPGGNAIDPKMGASVWGKAVYFPSSPLRYIREQAAPGASITYDPGTDPAAAAKSAGSAQLAIVFVTQWMSEGQDSPTLSLPDHQDALVAAVAAAQPNTIVVLENGGPVNMPWAPNVKGILESWFPGIGGGQAIANILFGRVNPSGKLPVTFAATEADLPHPHVTGLTEKTGNNGADAAGSGTQARDFPVDYNLEGMAVGYRWFQEKHKQPQFPFGFGLSYTHFAYSNLKVDPAAKSVSVNLRNTGAQAGDEIAEVYVTLPASAGEPFRKLAGWKRVSLAGGATQTVEIPIDPLYLSIYSTASNAWTRPAGDFLIEAGGSSTDLPLHQSLRLAAQ
jgi:beta-glucosidase